MSNNQSTRQRGEPRPPATGQHRQKTNSRPTSRRAQRHLQAERAQRRRRLAMLGGAVGAAALLALTLILISRPGGDDAAADQAIVDAPERDVAVPQDGHTLGNPDAPVTVIEYADFQCPACGQFARTIEPQLIAEYIQPGKVKLVYHDFPFLDDRASGNESDNASEAALCAQAQGEFWAYHDTLYFNQSGENEGAFATDRLIEMAAQVGLDVTQFSACIEGDEHEDDVQALYDAAREQGINSTPTLVVNGKVLTGVDYAALKQEIEAALASS